MTQKKPTPTIKKAVKQIKSRGLLNSHGVKDTELVQLNKPELGLLRMILGTNGEINPKTGLLSFKGGGGDGDGGGADRGGGGSSSGGPGGGGTGGGSGGGGGDSSRGAGGDRPGHGNAASSRGATGPSGKGPGGSSGPDTTGAGPRGVARSPNAGQINGPAVEHTNPGPNASSTAAEAGLALSRGLAPGGLTDMGKGLSAQHADATNTEADDIGLLGFVNRNLVAPALGMIGLRELDPMDPQDAQVAENLDVDPMDTQATWDVNATRALTGLASNIPGPIGVAGTIGSVLSRVGAVPNVDVSLGKSVFGPDPTKGNISVTHGGLFGGSASGGLGAGGSVGGNLGGKGDHGRDAGSPMGDPNSQPQQNQMPAFPPLGLLSYYQAPGQHQTVPGYGYTTPGYNYLGWKII